MAMQNYGNGYVLGRQPFVELWSLLGLVAVVCEGPEDFPGCFQKLQGEEVAFVLVESDWAESIPKLETGEAESALMTVPARHLIFPRLDTQITPDL